MCENGLNKKDSKNSSNMWYVVSVADHSLVITWGVSKWLGGSTLFKYSCENLDAAILFFAKITVEIVFHANIWSYFERINGSK